MKSIYEWVMPQKESEGCVIKIREIKINEQKE